MAKLYDTDIDGDLNIDGNLLVNGTNILDLLNSTKEIIDTLNNIFSTENYGRLILPSGLKIFYGIGQLSVNSDPAGNFSAKIIFPEPYTTDKSYYFNACATVCDSGANRNDDLRNYYSRSKTFIWVGSKTIGGAIFNWFSIGY